MKKKIVFITGTRADFGKLRSLIDVLSNQARFEVHVFVTGMHMLRTYGYTCNEVERRGYKNIYKFINQNCDDTMDSVLGKTISGLSDFVKEVHPDLIVVHGDRVEALAGAAVGSLNNILVAHIEGGEVSGTVDDLIRHSVSKLSHVHFVSNDKARTRLLQLGEDPASIFTIGSPDVDALFASDLPSMADVRQRYNISYERYGILMFHPVTTELDSLPCQVQGLVDAALASGDNFVVIYPNNDSGTKLILKEFERFKGLERIKVFPSMRFDCFLTLMRNAHFMLGNSSSAIMEAPYYGVPAVNIGSRQHNRFQLASVIQCLPEREAISRAIDAVKGLKVIPAKHFGEGGSDKKFCSIVLSDEFWSIRTQKYFLDLEPDHRRTGTGV